MSRRSDIDKAISLGRTTLEIAENAYMLGEIKGLKEKAGIYWQHATLAEKADVLRRRADRLKKKVLQ